MQKATKRDQNEINHMHIFMDKLGYTIYSTSESKQAARIRVLFGRSVRCYPYWGSVAIWQNYPALAKHFADNITRPPFGGLQKILTCSTFLKNLALMVDAFCEIYDLSLALQSESTTLSKAYELVKRCISALAQFNEGHRQRGTHSRGIMCCWCSS